MHRVGGLEKADGTGHIDYTPENHERMVNLRAAKVAAIAADIPPIDVRGDQDADVLVVGWGSTWAAIDAAVQRRRRAGHKVASTHLVHLNPLPSDLGEVLARYRKVIVPELNSGQLCNILRAKYLVDARAVTKVQGLPFKSREIETAIDQALGEISTEEVASHEIGAAS
jgi:2-oxoglutarate ferredoxin oxidoreductase subunit alpha